MKAIQSYIHVENIFLCFAFVCLVVLPKIWLASSYVFSGHYLTSTMFIVIVTKPKIKKKRKLRKSRFYVVISIVIVIVIVMLKRSQRQCKWYQNRIWLKMSKNLVPNAKKVDNPIYWINLYPEDSAIPRGHSHIWSYAGMCHWTGYDFQGLES